MKKKIKLKIKLNLKKNNNIKFFFKLKKIFKNFLYKENKEYYISFFFRKKGIILDFFKIINFKKITDSNIKISTELKMFLGFINFNGYNPNYKYKNF